MKLVTALGLVALTTLVACAGDTGPAGPAGPKGENGGTGDSINGITPAKAFLGRTTTVQISGNNTSWESIKASDISFGDGVTVKSVTVASPSALLVTVEIAETAKTGAHDITIGTQTFKGFQILAPGQIGQIAGTAAQGSIVVGSVKNLDLENPFNTDLLDFKALTGGVTVSIGTPQVFSADFQATIDVTATAGAKSLVLENGDGTTYVTDTPLTIAARSAANLDAAAPAQITLGSKPLESALYTISVPAKSVLSLKVAAAAGSSAEPAFTILPASGKWADAVATFTDTFELNNATGTAAKSYYVIFLDTSGATGAKFTPTVTTTTFTQFEAEPNDTLATANTLATLPSDMLSTLASGTDVDWFKVTIPAGGQKKIVAKTVSVDSKIVNSIFGPTTVKTDTILSIVKADGTEIAASSDQGYDESLTSGNLAPGDYYVKVGQSPEGTWSADLSGYRVQVSLQ